MPTVLIMIGTVMVVVEFLKTAAAKLNLTIEGAVAYVVAVLASVGVWGYHILQTGTAIDFAAIMLLGEVIIGATMGYKLLPESVKTFDLKNLRGEVLNRGSSL